MENTKKKAKMSPCLQGAYILMEETTNMLPDTHGEGTKDIGDKLNILILQE